MPGKQLPRPEKPVLKEDMGPTVPTKLGALQEPIEWMEDIREKLPVVPQRPLADPAEKVGVQIWVAMMLVRRVTE